MGWDFDFDFDAELIEGVGVIREQSFKLGVHTFFVLLLLVVGPLLVDIGIVIGLLAIDFDYFVAQHFPVGDDLVS
jgi:hypothetical protein